MRRFPIRSQRSVIRLGGECVLPVGWVIKTVMASSSAMAAEKVQEEVKVQGCSEEKEQRKVDDVQEAGGQAGNLGED